MTRIALVGAGRWGSNWARTLASLPQTELRWICDVNEGTLERVGAQHPSVPLTTNLQDLWSDESLDAVVIATIAPTHFDVAKQALNAGKHTLVEKPMTLTTAEAAELNELAARRGRILMVGHLLEYHPAVLYVKELIDCGDLGDVHYLYSQRLNLGTVRRDENAWWSLAPHDISVACRLLDGDPISVQCRGQNVVQQHVEDIVFAMLEFPGGKLAHIHVSWLDPHKTRKLTVVGSKRMVVFDDTLPSYKVTVYDKGFSLNEEFNSYAQWISYHQGDVVSPKIDGTEPLKQEALHFVECIEKRLTPISDGESGAQVVSVLEYGQQSLENGGQVIQLPQADAATLRKVA